MNRFTYYPTEEQRKDVVMRLARASTMMDRTVGMPAHIEWVQVVAELEAEMRKWPSRAKKR